MLLTPTRPADRKHWALSTQRNPNLPAKLAAGEDQPGNLQVQEELGMTAEASLVTNIDV